MAEWLLSGKTRFLVVSSLIGQFRVSSALIGGVPVWSEVNDFSRLGLRLDCDSWLLVAGAAQTQTLHSALADVNISNNKEPVCGYLPNLST